jgi:hypothetical protein
MIDESIDVIWQRALRALATRGAMIETADRSSGVIATRPATTQVTEQDADCGNILGIPYLRDRRTTATVAYSLLLEQSGSGTTVTISTQIEAIFIATSTSPSLQLLCVSLGTLDRSLISSLQSTHP